MERENVRSYLKKMSQDSRPKFLSPGILGCTEQLEYLKVSRESYL